MYTSAKQNERLSSYYQDSGTYVLIERNLRVSQLRKKQCAKERTFWVKHHSTSVCEFQVETSSWGEVQNPSHVYRSIVTCTTFVTASVESIYIANRVDVDTVATSDARTFKVMVEKYRRVDVVETAFGNGDNTTAVPHFPSKLRRPDGTKAIAPMPYQNYNINTS